MPNTKPPLDNEAQVEFVLQESQVVGLANVFPIGAITKGRDGKELAEIGSMHKRGAVAFSDDGVGVADPAVMRKALQYAKMFDTVLMQHCEEPSLSGGAMHAGVVSTALGLPGVPAEAEQLMIARDLLLNRTIGCRYHVQHISTAWSVELVRRAKRDGHAVTAEVAPHHLLLTDEACRGYDTNYKMNPPLRTAGRREGRASPASSTARSTAWRPITRRTSRREGTGVPKRAQRHHRPRRRARALRQGAGRAGPHRLDAPDRADDHRRRADCQAR
jgi:dihydroorotase-like cyclic amidohydrolase